MSGPRPRARHATSGRRHAASNGLADEEREIVSSLGRLRAAGILDLVAYDQSSQEGAVRFSPAMLRLLLAGRYPEREPEFWAAFFSGDPARVRAWIEREAASLPPLEAPR